MIINDNGTSRTLMTIDAEKDEYYFYDSQKGAT